jgi:hypothetical protein
MNVVILTCEFRHDIARLSEYLGRMGTSTLWQRGRLDGGATVTDLGDSPDFDADARFWAAIDLMDDLLTPG